MRLDLEGRIEEVEIREQTKKSPVFNNGHVCHTRKMVVVVDAGFYEGSSCLVRFDAVRKSSNRYPLGHFISSYVPRDFKPLANGSYVLFGMWPGRTLARSPPAPDEVRRYFCPGNLHRYIMIRKIDREDKMSVVDTTSTVSVEGSLPELVNRYMSNIGLTRFVLVDTNSQLLYYSKMLESNGIRAIKAESIDINRVGGRLEYVQVLEKMSQKNTVGIIKRTSDYVIIRSGNLDKGDRIVVKVDHDKHPAYSRLFASVVCRELPDGKDSMRYDEYVLVAKWPYINTDPMGLKLDKINHYFDPGRTGWCLYVQDNGCEKPIYHLRSDSVTKRHVTLDCVHDISAFLPDPHDRPRLIVCSSDSAVEEVRKSVERVGLSAVEMTRHSHF